MYRQGVDGAVGASLKQIVVVVVLLIDDKEKARPKVCPSYLNYRVTCQT
jgi:hypothetical protein